MQGLILNNAQGQRSINLALLTQLISLWLALVLTNFYLFCIYALILYYYSHDFICLLFLRIYNMSCAEMTSKVGVAHKISRALTQAVYLAPPTVNPGSAPAQIASCSHWTSVPFIPTFHTQKLLILFHMQR